MKTIKIFKEKIALFFSLLILLVSCSKENTELLEETSNNKISKFSGEQLFRGIMFYQGEVAEVLPIAMEQKKIQEKFNDEIKLKLDKVHSDMIQVLKAQNPVYFENFKLSILSGNHLEIQKQLHQSSQDIKANLTKFYNFDMSQKSTVENAVNKLFVNSKLNTFRKSNGTIDVDKMNELYNSENNFYHKSDEIAACLAIVVVVALVFLYVIEHNRAEVVSGSTLTIKSNFDSEIYVNEIVKYTSK